MKRNYKVAIFVIVGISIGFAILPVLAVKWNHVPIFSKPGFFIRMGTYLSTNIAETRDDHTFPELLTPRFDVPANNLWNSVTDSIHQLGWDVEMIDESAMEVKAVITTPMMQFKDDLVVRVHDDGEHKSSLYIRSSSRAGKGDLGQNTETVLMLLDKIHKQTNSH
jgi:uncharacterized protein (DUF1499 family)